jgi:hypothetical protein
MMQPLVLNLSVIVPNGMITPAHIFHNAGFRTFHTSAANTTTTTGRWFVAMAGRLVVEVS